jgi:NAD(P)-dependent dehydrogenase (short-subunit alcohol dehydrogenase family)
MPSNVGAASTSSSTTPASCATRASPRWTLADFRLVLDVHLMGAVICTQAVWPLMRAQKYGRIVMTTSSSGLYGNFGQANYGAAKMALVGLMQTLSIEGAKDGIRVNCLAPTAATRMTEGLLPPPVLER